jgi:hypothetical protein
MRNLLKWLFRVSDSPKPIRDPRQLYPGKAVELHNYANPHHHKKVMDCTVLSVNHQNKEVTFQNEGPEDQFDPGSTLERWSFYSLGLNNSSNERSPHHCLVPKQR